MASSQREANMSSVWQVFFKGSAEEIAANLENYDHHVTPPETQTELIVFELDLLHPKVPLHHGLQYKLLSDSHLKQNKKQYNNLVSYMYTVSQGIVLAFISQYLHSIRKRWLVFLV